MKYFTKDWCFSNLDDCEIEKRLESYRNYISDIYIKLPFSLKLLAKSLNLHDGKIKDVSFIQNEKILILSGIFGDLDSGYYFLEVKYISIYNLDVKILTSIFSNKEIEILSDEIEFLKENFFSHRILFSTKKDINFEFEDVYISVKNATSKDYKKLLCQLRIV